MKYNIVFKFLAIALCALMLLGAAGSAAAIIGMTESGLYDISVEELRDRYIRSDGESMAGRIAVDYAEANLGGVPEAIAGPTVYDLGPSGKTGWLYGVFNPALAGYVLKDAEGNVLESGGAENLSDAERSVISSVKKYIRTHYAEVTLDGVAEYVHLNPYYLSTFFKQQTGEKFSD